MLYGRDQSCWRHRRVCRPPQQVSGGRAVQLSSAPGTWAESIIQLRLHEGTYSVWFKYFEKHWDFLFDQTRSLFCQLLRVHLKWQLSPFGKWHCSNVLHNYVSLVVPSITERTVLKSPTRFDLFISAKLCHYVHTPLGSPGLPVDLTLHCRTAFLFDSGDSPGPEGHLVGCSPCHIHSLTLCLHVTCISQVFYFQ